VTFKFADSPLDRYVRLLHNRRLCYLQDRGVGPCRRYFASNFTIRRAPISPQLRSVTTWTEDDGSESPTST
jgi:hypothetical protein